MGTDQSEHNALSKTALSTPEDGRKSHKRKRAADGSGIASSTPTPSKKHKKNKTDQQKSRWEEESGTRKKTSKDLAVSREKKETPPRKTSAASPSRRGSKSIAGHDHDDQPTGKSDSARKKRGGDGAGTAGASSNLRRGTPDTEEDEEVAALKSRHAGILSKFAKSQKVAQTIQAKRSGQDATKQEILTAEPVIAQGLEPLPQPEAAPEQLEKPTYSSLPAWLAEPLRVSVDERRRFSELGVGPSLLKILAENGYKESFAVQSAVIPLLLRGAKRHPGDLCVSAATGSGKTLSYVLPLVTDLQPLPAPRLRGLIVVPTRELVRQARDACELCAAGSRLRIGSAVGNVAIKDEQSLLMRVDQVHAPDIFRAQQKKAWTGDDWIKFSLMDYLSECEDRREMLPDYVVKSEPNVDILICTPGRLVDHLRYTRGFTLQHLQWLVIDEADRLLNESFQEWVDVVMRSLDARKMPDSYGFAGSFLAEVGHPIFSKEPRKVVLSATMTKDITKLNSLRLSNPKLVVIGGGDDDVEAGDAEGGKISRPDAQFALPPTLKEFIVAVGDGSQKPLYLLRLLLSHMKVAATSTGLKHALSDASSDSEDTSSDESDSEESTSTDSDSDSDPESHSSSSDEESSSESDSASETSASEDGSPAVKARSLKTTEITSKRTTVLIFTKSSESASRLSRLLSLLNPSLASQVGTIVKSNKSSASRKTLSAYRRGKISVIVATDRASRGLDLQSLAHVVNYDVPTSVTSYVHRVGRTARAGKEGTAWTLVAHREGRWFANEIVKRSDGTITRTGNVEKVTVKLDDMDDTLKSEYEAALDALEGEVKSSRKGKPATPKA